MNAGLAEENMRSKTKQLVSLCLVVGLLVAPGACRRARAETAVNVVVDDIGDIYAGDENEWGLHASVAEPPQPTDESPLTAEWSWSITRFEYNELDDDYHWRSVTDGSIAEVKAGADSDGVPDPSNPNATLHEVLNTEGFYVVRVRATVTFRDGAGHDTGTYSGETYAYNWPAASPIIVSSVPAASGTPTKPAPRQKVLQKGARIIHIYDESGKELTGGKPTEIWAGQRIRLTATVGENRLDLTDGEWYMDPKGGPIKDWVVQTDKKSAHMTYHSTTELKAPAITFYFIADTGGRLAEVKFGGHLEEGNKYTSSSVYFRVKKPTYDVMVLQEHRPTLSPESYGYKLAYVGPQKYGILFSASRVGGDSAPDTTQWVQVLRSHSYAIGDGASPHIDACPALDGYYPYPAPIHGATSDAPDVGGPSLYLEKTQKASMYLMWRAPAPSIWVSIKRVDWGIHMWTSADSTAPLGFKGNLYEDPLQILGERNEPEWDFLRVNHSD